MESGKTDNILNSLDGVQRATAPDFFYTRLKARMEQGVEGSLRQPSWFLRPAYIAAALVLVFAANAFVLLNNGKSDNTVLADDNDGIQQTIAADYSLADNNIIYDLNQDR